MRRTTAAAVLALGLILAASVPAPAQFRDWMPCLEERLHPEQGIVAGRFGASVGIHRDILIVGAPGIGSPPGYARIYGRVDGVWQHEAVLAATRSTRGELFGTSVAIDGHTAVVGAPGHGAGGAAYVFERSTNGWQQTAVLTPPNTGSAETAQFGLTVDVEGKILLVGAPGSRSATGAVHVYRRNGGWTHAGTLEPPELVPGDRFGDSLSLSLPRAIVGAPFHDADGRDAGAAWIFRRTGRTAVLETRLRHEDTRPGDRFGASVHLNDTLAIVGAPFNDDAGFGTGAAYVFSPSGTGNGAWLSHGALYPLDAYAGENFGWSVSIGPVAAVVGALRGEGTTIDSGSAYVFAASDAVSWRPVAELSGEPAEWLDEFGIAVAHQDRWAVIGAPNEGGFRGSVYIYNLYRSCPRLP